MAYGHAQRCLAAIGQLEAETRQLLAGLGDLDQEQEAWLEEADLPVGPPASSASIPTPREGRKSSWSTPTGWTRA
jgi:hypothetical protein